MLGGGMDGGRLWDVGCSHWLKHHKGWEGKILLGVVFCKGKCDRCDDHFIEFQRLAGKECSCCSLLYEFGDMSKSYSILSIKEKSALIWNYMAAANLLSHIAVLSQFWWGLLFPLKWDGSPDVDMSSYIFTLVSVNFSHKHCLREVRSCNL